MNTVDLKLLTPTRGLVVYLIFGLAVVITEASARVKSGLRQVAPVPGR